MYKIILLDLTGF